jgi:uncharacterized integral membrane protein (TIGR00698 family)
MEVLYVIVGLIITLPIATKGFYCKKNLPGFLLCLAIALPAWFLGQRLAVAGGAIFGIVLGIILANFWRYPDIFKAGVKETSKRMLQSAVLLLGFGMNFGAVLQLGVQTLSIIFAVISSALLAGYLISRKLKDDSGEQTLIAVGTAICGGSAIAAAAPVIKATDKAVAGAISTVFLFNVIAVFVFPLIGHITGMSDLRFGTWAGTAINDTSSVLAAADSYSEGAVAIAAVVKLTRALMIVPVTFGLALIWSRRESRTGSSGFKLSKALPWFVVGFLAACIINTLNISLGGIVPFEATAFFGKTMSRFLIVLAMAGIGLSTNLKELLRHGKKTLLLGFSLNLIVVAVSILLMNLFSIA